MYIKKQEELVQQYQGFISFLKAQGYNENTTKKLQEVLSLSQQEGTISSIDTMMERYNYILPPRSFEILSTKYRQYLTETITSKKIDKRQNLLDQNSPDALVAKLSQDNVLLYDSISTSDTFLKSLIDKELYTLYKSNGGYIDDANFIGIVDAVHKKVNTIDMVIDRQYWIDYYDAIVAYQDTDTRQPSHIISLAILLIEHKLVEGAKYKNILESIRKKALSKKQYGEDNYDIITDMVLDGKIDTQYMYVYHEFLPLLLKKYGSKEKERFQGLVQKGIISAEEYTTLLTETLNKYRASSTGGYLDIINCIYDYGIPVEQCKQDIEKCLTIIISDNYISHLDTLCKIIEFGVIDVSEKRVAIEKFFWHTFASILNISEYDIQKESSGKIITGFDTLKNLVIQFGIFDVSIYTIPLEIFANKKQRYDRSQTSLNPYSIKFRGLDLKIEPSYNRGENSYRYYNQTKCLLESAQYFEESDLYQLEQILANRIETMIAYKRCNTDFIKELEIIFRHAAFLDKKKVIDLLHGLTNVFPWSLPNSRSMGNSRDCQDIWDFIAFVYSTGFLVQGDDQKLEETLKKMKGSTKYIDELIDIGLYQKEDIDTIKSDLKMEFYYKELDAVKSQKHDFGISNSAEKRIDEQNIKKHINKTWLRSFHKPEYQNFIENKNDTTYGNEITDFMKFIDYGVTLAKQCVISHEIQEKLLSVIDYFSQYPEKLSIIKKNKLLENDLERIYGLIVANDVIGLRVYDVHNFYKPDERIILLEYINLWGAKGVYDYLGQGERDAHDAVEQSDMLVKFYKKEFGKENIHRFVSLILKEVGSSNIGYYQLNNFLRQYKPNWRTKVQSELSDPDGIKNDKLIQLSNHILSLDKSGVLHTRRELLYQIGDICYILNQKPALLKINQLSTSNDPQDVLLYEYYSTGILSPRKKDIQAMMTMYTDPEKFLGLDDSNAPSALHSNKKPKHMVSSFPHLDMDAKDLVNTLPLGVYDAISYFKPMQSTFLIDKNNNITHVSGSASVDDMLAILLSSIENKQLSILVKNYNNTEGNNKYNDTMSFVSCKNNYNTLPDHQKERLKKQLACQKFTATITPKSDIANRYNGFNCDALSLKHGKKVVMMFNPYCADFCLYKDNVSDKEDNLLATSWITLNIPTGKNITDLTKKIEKGQDPRTIFDDNVIKQHKEYIVTLDNIEANANFAESIVSNDNKKVMLQKIYTIFFQEYIKENSVSPNNVPINTQKINCGTTYGKINIFDEKEKNETMPIFLNSYSDNIQEDTLKIPIQAGNQISYKKKQGIYPMSIEDIMQIVYLEGTIYPDGIKEHAANIQHEITASILNNTMKNRKNLSIVSYNNDGQMVGYCLAYQGIINKKEQTPCIYIKDLAVSDLGKGHGLTMIRNLLENIAMYYDNLPIVAELRESTSYPLIIKLLPRYGYKITKDSLGTFANGEKKHEVLLEKIS